MRLYENVFVARSDLAEEEVEKLGEKVSGVLTESGGEIVFYKYCGVRNLSYDISNNNKGHFCLIQFNGDGDVIERLDHTLKVNEDVIRHITVCIPESNEDLREILIKEKKDFE